MTMELLTDQVQLLVDGSEDYTAAAFTASLLLNLFLQGCNAAGPTLARMAELTVDEATLAFHDLNHQELLGAIEPDDVDPSTDPDKGTTSSKKKTGPIRLVSLGRMMRPDRGAEQATA